MCNMCRLSTEENLSCLNLFSGVKRNSELLTVLNSLPQVQVCPSAPLHWLVCHSFRMLIHLLNEITCHPISLCEVKASLVNHIHRIFKAEPDCAGHEENAEEWKKIRLWLPIKNWPPLNIFLFEKFQSDVWFQN